MCAFHTLCNIEFSNFNRNHARIKYEKCNALGNGIDERHSPARQRTMLYAVWHECDCECELTQAADGGRPRPKFGNKKENTRRAKLYIIVCAPCVSFSVRATRVRLLPPPLLLQSGVPLPPSALSVVRFWRFSLLVANDSLVRFILSILLAIIDRLLEWGCPSLRCHCHWYAARVCVCVSMSGEKHCADPEFMLCHVSVHEL